MPAKTKMRSFPTYGFFPAVIDLVSFASLGINSMHLICLSADVRMYFQCGYFRKISRNFINSGNRLHVRSIRCSDSMLRHIDVTNTLLMTCHFFQGKLRQNVHSRTLSFNLSITLENNCILEAKLNVLQIYDPWSYRTVEITGKSYLITEAFFKRNKKTFCAS